MQEVLCVVYTVESTGELIASLRADSTKACPTDPKIKPHPPRVIMTFTGQGSHYAGMGKQLYRYSPMLRNLLHIYEQMAEHQNLPPFVHLIADADSDIATASTVSVQLAVVALEIAIAHLLKTWNISPDVVMGHSLGEYSALCVAGVVSVSDTMFLVGRRAQLMEKHLTSGQYVMLAVESGIGDVRRRLKEMSLNSIDIACLNTPNLTVVSGSAQDINAFKLVLVDSDVRATVLRVPYGFHSRHIEPILDELEALAGAVTFSAPAIAVASTLEGEVVESGTTNAFSPSYLRRQARESVNFAGALDALKKRNFVESHTYFLEVGPEPVCIGLVRRTLKTPSTHLIATLKSSADDWVTVCSTLARLHEGGAALDWTRYYKEFKGTVSLLPLPTYAFDEKDYWTPFVERTSATAVSACATVEQQLVKAQTPCAFSTTSLQRVAEEVFGSGTATVTFASHASEPNLLKAIQGHTVIHQPIASLSMFCDMAKTAAQYAYLKLRQSDKVPPMVLYGIEMTNGLIVTEPDPAHILKTVVTYSRDTDVAELRFFSERGSTSVEHGSCKIAFEDSTPWFAQNQQLSFLVSTRIGALKEMASNGKAHWLLKPVVYKLFGKTVVYDEAYQGMKEVWVDSDCRDAVATVKMPGPAVGVGNFQFNPFWTDTAIHLAGFLVNAGLKYSEETVCISTGFESWRLVEELRADVLYTTYVSMLDTENPNILSGTAYVYNDEQKLVQVTTGIRFQKMSRTTFGAIFRGGSSRTTKKPSPSPRPEVMPSYLQPLTPSSGEGSVSGSSSNSLHGSEIDRAASTMTTASSIIESDEAESKESKGGLIDALPEVLAEEIGVEITDISENGTFADLGMDSLMSITVLTAFQKVTGVELPATFFLQQSTLSRVREALTADQPGEALSPDHGAGPDIVIVAGSEDPSMTNTPLIPKRQPIDASSLERSIEDGASISTTSSTASGNTELSSRAVLIQGSTSSNGLKFFLFPDGTGSPSQYLTLPPLEHDINIYALESPFVRAPGEYTCGFDVVCEAFVNSVRETQPAGPYSLGGCSLGALYAYEAARRLLRSGEQVERLVIIDMAVPKAVSGHMLPTREQLVAAGLLPAGRLTDAAVEHTARTAWVLSQNPITPCTKGQRPQRTVLLSAVTRSRSAEHTPLAQWAQGATGSPSRGWAELLGGPVEFRTVDAEPMAMFRYPAAQSTAKIIADVLMDVE